MINSVFLENSLTRIHWRIFMVSAMLPISIMSAVTLPVNIVIAVSRLIRGFYSVWVKVISLPVPRLT